MTRHYIKKGKGAPTCRYPILLMATRVGLGEDGVRLLLEDGSKRKVPFKNFVCLRKMEEGHFMVCITQESDTKGQEIETLDDVVDKNTEEVIHNLRRLTTEAGHKTVINTFSSVFLPPRAPRRKPPFMIKKKDRG